jgi:hypothetical protein
LQDFVAQIVMEIWRIKNSTFFDSKKRPKKLFLWLEKVCFLTKNWIEKLEIASKNYLN